MRDAEREPRIAQHGSPIKHDFDPQQVVGYLLNDVRRGCCTFFNQVTRQCGIYETRPLACRCFDCHEWLRDNPPPPVSKLTEPERQQLRQRLETLIVTAHACVGPMTKDDALQLRYAVAATITEQFTAGHLTYIQWQALIDRLWPEHRQAQATGSHPAPSNS